MKTNLLKMTSLALAGSLVLLAGSAIAQQKDTLAIWTVAANKSVMAKAHQQGTSSGLEQMIEALDGQLLDAFNATRKFSLVARSDLEKVLREQDLGGSGNVDPATAAKVGKILGAKYVMVATLDSYADDKRTARMETLNKTVFSRNVRVSAVGKIYDSSTSKLLESANFQLATNFSQSVSAGVDVKADLGDELFILLARDLAAKFAHRVADVAYPCKVVAKRDKQITLNRGEGTDIAKDQIWNVYAVGEELIDPDTKEILGREEVLVGTAKINGITPLTSTAELLDDRGVQKGSILRLLTH